MHEVLTWPVGRDGEDEAVLSRIKPPIQPVAIYIGAATVGGAAVGTLIATTGHVARYLPETTLRTGALTIILVAAALELMHRVAPLPQPQRQVPRAWTLWPSRNRTAAAFGLVIGAGVFTYFQHATMYVLGTLLLFAPTVQAGIVLGAVYGLGRGIPVLITWVVNVVAGRRVAWDRLVAARRHAAVGLTALSMVAVWRWPLI